MVRPEIRKAALSLAVAGVLAAGFSQAHASAFALIEQNSSGLGNAYAGQAAAAEDASTIFFNPAGMSLLGPGMHLSTGLTYIDFTTKFHDNGSVAATGRPLGGEGGNAGKAVTVPNIYFAMDVSRDLKFGVGVSVPFGLATEYDPSWIGRFQAVKSELTTYNINPSVSYRLSDAVSVGAGLNYQHIDAELTNKVSFGFLGIPIEPTAKVTGNDSAWGYNFGTMFRLGPDTRLGVSYRSSIKYHVTGTVEFLDTAGLPGAVLAGIPNGNISLDVKMPDSASFAARHQLDPKWALLADATWTGWSKIKDLTIVRDNGMTLSSTPENFKNTWRIGLGATYRHSDALSIKTGVAHDETPVNDTDRTPRLPDPDRTWLSVGAQWRLSPSSALDFGLAHLFIKDASINQNAGSTATKAQLTGTYKGSINIFGVQFAYKF